jgi:hypothetical protein
LIKKMMWYIYWFFKIQRQTRRSMLFDIQMITNDLVTGIDQQKRNVSVTSCWNGHSD